MSELKKCPCGEVPAAIEVFVTYDGAAVGSPSCCSFWEFTFAETGSKTKDQATANKLWGAAPRGES